MKATLCNMLDYVFIIYFSKAFAQYVNIWGNHSLKWKNNKLKTKQNKQKNFIK